MNCYERAVAKRNEMKGERERRMARDRQIRIFIEMLKTQPLILEKWDARLWSILLEKATVFRAGSIVFDFKNNTTITIVSEAGAV